MFLKFTKNVKSFMSVKMILVLWVENVFSHGSGVCHNVYGVWGFIEELCPSTFYFYVWYHLVHISMMMKTFC